MPPLESIINSDLLIDRFGRWPSFHDAEVFRLMFGRDGKGSNYASFVIHAWTMLSEVDERGYNKMTNHTLVELRADHLLESEWSGFNQQNVIFDLNVASINVEGHPALRLDMSNSFGLSGFMIAVSLSVVSAKPCTPEGQPVAA